jgi:hypothetical protein
MKDPLPFELLIVRSLISLALAIERVDGRVDKYIEPTLKELRAYENDWHQRQSFEDTH